MTYKWIGLGLTIISLILLYPGITLPMFFMDIKINIASGFGNFNFDALKNSYSILQSVKDLWLRDKEFVGSLILFFSVIVPVIKAILFFMMHFLESHRILLSKILGVWSKWSMADVFVVAILLTYMATGNEVQSHVEELKVFGMTVKLNIDLITQTELLRGFYYFLAYCLTSLAATSIYSLDFGTVSDSVQKDH